MIQPGGTIGILGGGQLGRMLAMEAHQMGYQIHTYDPHENGPAAQVSDHHHASAFSDHEALKRFASQVDVVTFEFENIPIEALEVLETETRVFPRKEVLHICQNRQREKDFLSQNGYPVAPYRVIENEAELNSAVQEVGPDCILKTADFGYDGKGQFAIGAETDLSEIYQSFGNQRGVLEKKISFQAECSVVVARRQSGETSTFPMAENVHRNHILHTSIVPARLPQEVGTRARELAARIANSLEVVGLLAVELFIDEENNLIVNELAPRPHNSGHYSFDACLTSQFEQHLRAVCDLPFGATSLHSPVVMFNLLGELWENGSPAWKNVLEEDHAKLHLYGKSEPQKGRKMGHFCVLNASIDEAIRKGEAIFEQLTLA